MVEASRLTPTPSSISTVRLVAYRFNSSCSFATLAAIRRAFILGQQLAKLDGRRE
jgi:hypothetical protein